MLCPARAGWSGSAGLITRCGAVLSPLYGASGAWPPYSACLAAGRARAAIVVVQAHSCYEDPLDHAIMGPP